MILTNLKFIGKHYDMKSFNLEVTKFTSHLPTSGQILFQDIFGIGRKSGIITVGLMKNKTILNILNLDENQLQSSTEGELSKLKLILADFVRGCHAMIKQPTQKRSFIRKCKLGFCLPWKIATKSTFLLILL